MTYRTDPGSYGLGRHLANMEAADYWASHHCHVCTRCEEKYEALKQLDEFIGRDGRGLNAFGLRQDKTGLHHISQEADNLMDTVEKAYGPDERLYPNGENPQDRIDGVRLWLEDLRHNMRAALPESSCDYHTDCGEH